MSGIAIGPPIDGHSDRMVRHEAAHLAFARTHTAEESVGHSGPSEDLAFAELHPDPSIDGSQARLRLRLTDRRPAEAAARDDDQPDRDHPRHDGRH